MVWVDLQSTAVKDADLVRLKPLASLRRLNLGYAEQVSDRGIAALAAFTELTELRLDGAWSYGGGLLHLRSLRKLRTLILDNTDVGDYGPEALAPLTQLETLSLNYAGGVGDDGLKFLAGMKHLRVLGLDYADVTNEGLKSLRGLPALEELTLAVDESITDAGWQHLKELRKLRKLDLGGTKITAATVARLGELPRLKEVHVGRIELTPAALRRWQFLGSAPSTCSRARLTMRRWANSAMLASSVS